MRRGRRVYDQLERKPVTEWMGRTEARIVRNTIVSLTPGAAERKYWHHLQRQPTARFILTRRG
jgi:hypothetical protein